MSRGPDIAIKPDVILEQYRCYNCGRFWAIERNVAAECPCCASRKVVELEDQVAALQRSKAAMRGARKRRRVV